jgi:hypothetical protein
VAERLTDFRLLIARYHGFRDLPYVGIAVAVVVAMIWPMYFAGFGMIDDHVQVAMWGQGHRMNPVRFWEHVEPLVFSGDGRWRPLHYPIVGVEAVVYGSHPVLWYLSRTVGALVVVVASYWVLKRWLPRIGSLCLALLLVVNPAASVWTRLGPSEAYAAPFAALGAAHLVPRVGQPLGALWPGFGLLGLAALCKENFVFLLPFAVGVAVIARIADGAWSRQDVLSSMFCGIAIFALAAPVWVVRQRYGDVYGASRGLSGLIDGSRRLLQPYGHLWALCLVFGVISLAFSHKSGIRAWVAGIGVGVVAAVALVGPQAIVYSGSEFARRYLMPSAVLPVGVAAAVIHSFQLTRRHLLRTAVPRILMAGLWVLVAAGAFEAREMADKSASFVRSFDVQMEALAMIDKPFVFEVGSILDYEPAISVHKHVTARRGEQPESALRVHDLAPSDPFQQRLLSQLHEWLDNSPIGDRVVDASRDATRRSSSRCVSVVFGGTADPLCSDVVFIYGGRDWPRFAVTG